MRLLQDSYQIQTETLDSWFSELIWVSYIHYEWRLVLMLIKWPYIVYHMLCNSRQQGSPKHCCEVGGSIPGCEISSLNDWKLARWSTSSCGFGFGLLAFCPKRIKIKLLWPILCCEWMCVVCMHGVVHVWKGMFWVEICAHMKPPYHRLVTMCCPSSESVTRILDWSIQRSCTICLSFLYSF
jgi:hypothetical protein